MNLKPYFYYSQQYIGLSKSNEDSINSAGNDCKEVTAEVNSVSRALDPATGVEKQAGGANFETGKEENPEPIMTFEHSRFQEVAPGVFQFKHTRPNMVQHSQYLALPSQPDKKPEVDEFVRVSTFPGASYYGLPVYQFT